MYARQKRNDGSHASLNTRVGSVKAACYTACSASQTRASCGSFSSWVGGAATPNADRVLVACSSVVCLPPRLVHTNLGCKSCSSRPLSTSLAPPRATLSLLPTAFHASPARLARSRSRFSPTLLGSNATCDNNHGSNQARRAHRLAVYVRHGPAAAQTSRRCSSSTLPTHSERRCSLDLRRRCVLWRELATECVQDDGEMTRTNARTVRSREGYVEIDQDARTAISGRSQTPTKKLPMRRTRRLWLLVCRGSCLR